uniref:Uncharacterized protein n=1 Tax=Florenciella sp. virus SA2 TaxID=3240092 RepID=A0AB39JEW5_9VIRU
MKLRNHYILVFLIVVIFLSVFIDENSYNKREGFIGKALGKVITSVLSAGGPMFAPVITAVDEANGIVGKIIALVIQLVIMGLTIIFLPFAAIFCVYLFIQLIMQLPLLIKTLLVPRASLEIFGCDLN